MKISVIIPVYNRDKELIRAVDSIYEQSYQPAEIIVVDDGSAPAVSDILSNKKFKDIRIIRQVNKGVAAARNRGIIESEYEWLAFLDSDDWWFPEKLKDQVKYHESNQNILISQTDEIWIRNGQRINQKKYHKKKAGDIFQSSLERCLISPSAVMLHKSILKESGSFDETFPVVEDYDLWLRVCLKYQVGLIDKKLVVKTGGHPDQLSIKFWGMDRFRVKALEKILHKGMTNEKRQAVLKVLCTKLKILAEGSKKREKYDLVREYQEKYETYKQLQY